jgi:hypothetical protein
MAMRPGIGERNIPTAANAGQFILLGSWDLRATWYRGVWGGFNFTGGIWNVKQDGASTLLTGARLDTPSGFSCSFKVYFTDKEDAQRFRAYCVDNNENSDIAFFVRDTNWFFKVWGITIKQSSIDVDSPTDYQYYFYDVTVYFYSPYAYENPAKIWQTPSCTLPQNSGPLANVGHYDRSFDKLQIIAHYALEAHVHDLSLSIQSSESLILCSLALSDELWDLRGNDNYLLETYTDAFVSGIQWEHDTTISAGGAATFSSSHIKLNNGQSAYYRLSGPLPIQKPIKMTADLSLDSGLCRVLI